MSRHPSVGCQEMEMLCCGVSVSCREQLFAKRFRLESAHATDGVTCSLATNNVLNPVTPFGDCSLIGIANLYANVARLGDVPSLCSCHDMVTHGPTKLMNIGRYGVQVGNPV